MDYNQQKGKGKIEFQTVETVKTLLYKCLKIGEIEIFTWKSVEFFEKRAEPGLIVVGSINMNYVMILLNSFPPQNRRCCRLAGMGE